MKTTTTQRTEKQWQDEIDRRNRAMQRDCNAARRRAAAAHAAIGPDGFTRGQWVTLDVTSLPSSQRRGHHTAVAVRIVRYINDKYTVTDANGFSFRAHAADLSAVTSRPTAMPTANERSAMVRSGSGSILRADAMVRAARSATAVDVRIVSKDSFTGCEDSFDVTLPELTGEAVRDAYVARLAAEDPDMNVEAHRLDAWVKRGEGPCAFILSCDAEEYTGTYEIVIVGIVYQPAI